MVVVTLAPIALVVVGVALFWPRAAPPLERADLEADAAFALHMPGADDLGYFGGDRRFKLGGSFEDPPFAGHTYGTGAARAEVYSYFEVELTRLGWLRESPFYIGSSTDLEGRLYCKKGLGFRLAIKDKDRAFEAAFYRGRTYTTVFQSSLHPNDPKAPCPRPSSR
jgi:hypothetical protein